MRLSARDLTVTVSTLPTSERPIRLRAAGLIFAFTIPEALELATLLADTVEHLNRKAQP